MLCIAALFYVHIPFRERSFPSFRAQRSGVEKSQRATKGDVSTAVDMTMLQKEEISPFRYAAVDTTKWNEPRSLRLSKRQC
ncbi:hypothetical protein D3C72_1047770 [compost metagenome]